MTLLVVNVIVGYTKVVSTFTLKTKRAYNKNSQDYYHRSYILVYDSSTRPSPRTTATNMCSRAS